MCPTLNRYFSYNPEAGYSLERLESLLGWATNRGKARVTIRYSLYQIARIAWKMHYGTDPGDHPVEYRDNNTNNIKIKNLYLGDCPWLEPRPEPTITEVVLTSDRPVFSTTTFTKDVTL